MPAPAWSSGPHRSLLNSALKDVLEVSHDQGGQKWLRQSAINLIHNGYEAGVRDQKALADNALRIMGFGPSNGP
jgi:hypothetical protein